MPGLRTTLCVAALMVQAVAPVLAADRSLLQAAGGSNGGATCPSNPQELQLDLEEVSQACGESCAWISQREGSPAGHLLPGSLCFSPAVIISCSV